MTNEEFQKVMLEKFAENDKSQKVMLEKFADNDKFQKVMLEKFVENDKFQKVVISELKTLNNKIDKVESKFTTEINALAEGQKRIETRQDEIFQVVRAIEHSNVVGKSELDSHNIRVAKLEGKFKKIAKVCIEEDKVLNL